MKPEPMSNSELVKVIRDAWVFAPDHSHRIAGKAIEAEVNRRWEEMLSKQEPIAYFDFQNKGFRWASHTFIDPVPVSVNIEPMKLYAAPQQINAELLEALKKVRDRFFPADQPEHDRDIDWCSLNEAIKKAEGV